MLQIGTAAAAFMAIRIILDHGVREDRIIFVTFLVARGGGVSVLRRAFPQVKIVCGAVDDLMQEGWLEGYRAEGNPEGLGRKIWVMQPGMGQIGMVFCTRSLRVLCTENILQGIGTIYNGTLELLDIFVVLKLLSSHMWTRVQLSWHSRCQLTCVSRRVIPTMGPEKSSGPPSSDDIP